MSEQPLLGHRPNYVLPERELLYPGHVACPGCGASLSMRYALKALGDQTMVIIPACCWSIIAGPFPYSSLKTPIYHTAFETTGAVASGVSAALKVLGKKDITVMGWAGDGGTFDIGIQALSGAVERNEDFIYVCYDNEAYMNTGIQRSGATPRGAFTTTAPAGKVSPGKTECKKDLTAIVAAHGIPYVAQTSPHRARDLMEKVQKAVRTEGPCFINVLSPCPRGWRFKPEDSIQMCKLAAETCVWPLYEIEDGKVKINYKPREKKPVRAWLESQGRFKHLFSAKNEAVIEQFQQDVDRKWNALLKREETGT